jgi:membrane-associated phospholipid phosphatase
VRYRFAFLSLGGAFAALAVLVAAGAFTGLDQWAVDHLMPGGSFTAHEPSLVDALVPLHATHWHDPWSVAVNVVTLPASFLIALALVAWRSRLLAALLLAAVAVETLSKHFLDRPALHHGSLHVVGFDDSFPSGHALRAVIIAAVFLSPLSVAWAVAALVLLELAGWHTPTDIAGGIVLALLALLGARALRGRRLLRRRPL